MRRVVSTGLAVSVLAAAAAALPMAAATAAPASSTGDPVMRIAAAHTQIAYLKASNSASGLNFGAAVAVSGNTTVVGAYTEATGGSNAGAAYVFVNGGATHSAQAYLKAANAGANHRFGWSVAISGDTAVIGAPGEGESGAAYVFVRSGTAWTQQAYLKASNAGSGDQFGQTVGISGNTVVVGAHNEDSCATGVDGDGANNACSNAGVAYVFVRSGTAWTQQAYLKASNAQAGDVFGYSVGVDGNTIVVGASGEGSCSGNEADNSCTGTNGYAAGAAYVFVRSGTAWTQQAYLKAANTTPSSNASSQFDRFGFSVGVSGDSVVVGALGDDSCANTVNGDQTNNACDDSGAAYVFARSGATWSQQAYLKSSNPDDGWNYTPDLFGYAVGISRDTVAVAAPYFGGCSAGVNASTTQNTTPACDYAGAVETFTRSGTTWTRQAFLKASNTGYLGTNAPGMGDSVAVSGATVVAGAYAEDSCANTVDGNQSNVACQSAGAAYVFNTGETFPPVTVSFDPNGGQGSMSNQTASIDTPLVSNAFTLAQARFAGWNTVAGGSGTAYGNEELYPFINPTTLYAQWIPWAVVAFDPNGGTGSMATQSAGTNVALSVNTFTRSLHRFAGWNTVSVGGGTAYSDQAAFPFLTAPANTTLSAQWSPWAVVVFDPNGGTGAMTNQSVGNDGPLSPSTFTRFGFNFAGWNTVSVGGGTPYDDEDVFPFLTAPATTTLSAQWSPWEVVTFDANGGTGAMATQSAAPSSALNANAFRRDRYTFAGWATSTTSGVVAYANGAVFPFTSPTTLYALWTEDPALPAGIGGLVIQPVASPTTSPSPTTTNPPPTTTPATPDDTPVPALDPTGALPEVEPGDGLLVENGEAVPVEVLVENAEELVLRTQSQTFELRLAGDCTTGCSITNDATGRETIFLEEDGNARVSGFGFKPGTLVHVWMFSEPRYLGALPVQADGTYAGTFPLDDVAVGAHTLQANGISFDDRDRSANLGVVVQPSVVPLPSVLPATGTSSALVWLASVALFALVTGTAARRRTHDVC